MLMGKFYLYRHIREDKNIPFYIGIGTKRDRPSYRHTSEYERAYSKKSRNKYWSSIANITNYVVDILYETDVREIIEQKEKEFILMYKDTLVNITEGGEGTSGLEPWNKGVSMWETREHPNKGKKLAKEVCDKKSDSMKLSPKSLKGKKLPKEWISNISKGLRLENNHMFGKRGQETPNARFVIDLNTGIFWESVTEASEVYNFNMKTLYNKLSGHRINNTNLRLI